PRWIEIVGVAADVTHFGLAAPERPAVYTPYAQSMQSWKRWMVLVLRSRPGTPNVAGEARRRIWSVDPLLPVSGVRTMVGGHQASRSRHPCESSLAPAFAALALTLAAVGVFGVMAGSVRQRTSEIGVRMALGARPWTILLQVVAEGLRLTGLGIGLGLAA